MTHRRYNAVLLAVIGPVIALLAVTSLFLEPYDGGLTRLGGYSEVLYGWNEPQLRFPKPLYKQFMTREAAYREPADVVVLGDSFTFNHEVSWPNYFVQKTGLQLQAFRLDKTPIENVLESETFRQHPPRILIYETVERQLQERLTNPTRDCRLHRTPVSSPLPYVRLPINPEPYSRDTRAALMDFSLSLDFLTKVIPREYFGRDRTLTRRLHLRRAAPFSSTEKQQLLVYKGDFEKLHWSTAMWEQVRCNLVDLQNRVQSNGRTFFVAMIAPDKLTAYSELLTDPQYRALSRIDRLAVDPELHLPRLDLRLQRAIREGDVDIYLNNDTHWGSAGYEMVALELVTYMTRSGVIIPARQP